MCLDMPTIDQIMEALSSSGYMLEQEVASLIEDLNFHVQTNRAFEDTEEHKSREVDVVAIKRVYNNMEFKLSIFVELLVETKNNTNPFVFIGRNKTPADTMRIPQEYVFPVSKYEVELPSSGGNRSFREIPAFSYLNLNDNHYELREKSKAVQFCKIVRHNKSWRANHDGVYDSIFYPLVKCLMSRINEVSRQYQWKNIWLFFPIVVLNGPILYYNTSDKAGLIETGRVSFVREIKNKTIDGKFSIDFVNKDNLNQFVSTCIIPFSEKVISIAKETPRAFTEQKNPLGITLDKS